MCIIYVSKNQVQTNNIWFITSWQLWKKQILCYNFLEICSYFTTNWQILYYLLKQINQICVIFVAKFQISNHFTTDCQILCLFFDTYYSIHNFLPGCFQNTLFSLSLFFNSLLVFPESSLGNYSVQYLWCPKWLQTREKLVFLFCEAWLSLFRS